MSGTPFALGAPSSVMDFVNSITARLPKLSYKFEGLNFNWRSKDEYKALPSEGVFSRGNVSSPELMRRIMTKATCPPLT
jgi:hypothetical protein